MPDLILPDLSSLGYIELLGRSLVCDVVEVDIVLVRKLGMARVRFYPRVVSRLAHQ